MREVNVQCAKAAVDTNVRLELWDPVQLGFLVPPIIGLAPEIDGLADEFNTHPVIFAPLLIADIGRETSELKFSTEKVQLGVGDADLMAAVSDVLRSAKGQIFIELAHLEGRDGHVEGRKAFD